MKMSRPEYLAPPEIFYNEDEARKYTQNSRIIDIQVQMCERAIELLVLPEDTACYLLDIGCGSGLSGSVLEDQGHFWVGLDISRAMLDIAIEREVEGDLMLSDMGQGCPFKAGTFDGAVSISALQWLCNADKSYHKPTKRLYTFFSTLYACLSRSARAVFQFYPENSGQMELITAQAMKAGFYGGVVVDYPNSTKAKKYFLVLMTGGSVPLPKALGTNEDSQGYSNEVGEAFRSIIGRKWVNFSYAVATFYVLADTADKSVKSYKIHAGEENHTKKVLFTTADTLIWQLLASVVLPGFTINRTCAASAFLINKSRKLPRTTSKWLVTGVGLVTIPFIIKPIDDFVDFTLDRTLRKLQP